MSPRRPGVNHCPKRVPCPGIAVNGAAMTARLLRPSCDQRQAAEHQERINQRERSNRGTPHGDCRSKRESQILYEIVPSGVELGMGFPLESTHCGC